MRSCQLVYLLMLLCAVQVVEARALGLPAPGSAVSAAAESGLAERALVAARAERRGSARVADRVAQATDGAVCEWDGPAGQAAAVIVFSSFRRG